MYDLGIIGGGPAGYVAAERAGKNGLKVVLFEKKSLGGVCLNEGCIPTKTLLYSAKIFDTAKNGAKYGISANEVSCEFEKLMARKNKTVKKLVAGVGAKMKANKVEVVPANAQVVQRNSDNILLEANDQQYECKNILVCTGSEAAIPPIKGLERDKILTNSEILMLEKVPESLVIIGGGVIGTEFASFFNSLGTRVTVIEMLDEILTGMDVEISTMFRKELTKKGVEFHMGAKVTEISGNTVSFEKDGNVLQAKGEQILVSTGRKPIVDGFGLEKLGVELYKGGIKIDGNCRTNIPNVYAAGDVTGFSLLAHTASREGEVAVNHICGKKDSMRYRAIPGVVYTNPEVSGVGLTEEEAKKKGIDYEIQKLPMTYAGRFVAENEGFNGLCKVLVGKEFQQVLGVHMIGNPSSEIIYGAVMAIEYEMTIKELEEVVFPHPTVSEIFKETIFSF
ncbi:MAG: dihydrolipoyl dehydrogenase [Bacteroidales bacterium]|nr:dihydrolipoyl dehydrogenase [Bacteroidales bacterium]